MQNPLIIIAAAILAMASPSMWGQGSAGGAVTIMQVEPTPLFPKPAAGQPLKQLVRLHVDNPGVPFVASARVVLGMKALESQSVQVATGKSLIAIQIPDIAAPMVVTVSLLEKNGAVLATKTLEWQPQKKWDIYSCGYSHQDLGFGDYPHRIRTSIRHKNIELPLQFCRETDTWPDDAKYRFNIETSESLTSFIGFYGKEAARELGRRIKEGRIELGGLHNTVLSEELSHELMARLFYMSGRHAVDILGVPAGKTIQNDDVVGLTWPLATYAKEAGFDYCFHGFNRLCMPNIEHGRVSADMGALDSEWGRHTFAIGNEPNFVWQGPDGQSILRRATTYERHDLLNNPYEKRPALVQSVARVELLIRGHEKIKWPFHTLLSQDGGDFILVRRAIADRARKWNDEYAYPRIRLATFDEYFRAIQKEIVDNSIKLNTVAADENDYWCDQDYTVARASGDARKLSESLPATETLATFVQATTGEGGQWLNLFQGYHRLLQYFEHTNAKDSPGGNMAWYETELEENREMVGDAAHYCRQAFDAASSRLNALVARSKGKHLFVFNALPHPRTDVVRADIPAGCAAVDPSTGKLLPFQRLSDGTSLVLASNIPATGYQVFDLVGKVMGEEKVTAPDNNALESQFYRLQFNPVTGALTSLFDKTLNRELIEQNAPHAFNGYLYQAAGKMTAMQKADSITVQRGPVADILTVTAKAEGVSALTQTVTLYHQLKRVDFRIWMDKAPYRSKEAIFIALPFNIPDFTIHHELPGCVVEPYRQQVDGSCTAHYAVRSFTDLSNSDYGITVSPVECSLVCYGVPQVTPQPPWHAFNRSREYPKTSRLYLYLMNNVFGTNTALDQRGSVTFPWSLTSHAGDWKAGGADQFGRVVQQPLMAWRADGGNDGPLPASASFLSVDAPNVALSTLKCAEMNGRGLIIRLNETAGRETTTTLSLPMLPPIESVSATSLVENDRTEKYPVAGNAFKVTLPKFGVKTLRVICTSRPGDVSDIKAVAVADMQVNLTWKGVGEDIACFNIYRDTDPACAPTMLNFIGQSPGCAYSDVPRNHPGGWIRSCLEPAKPYYYRIVPVDRFNNPGTGRVVFVATPSSSQANFPPVAVVGLRAVQVSPISRDNFISLIFRTACEPDVAAYEIHRSVRPGFVPDKETCVGVIKSDAIPPRSGGYGEQPTPHKVREYDHATFDDRSVAPGTTYFYKVRAVDTAGQSGPFSEEVSVRTKGPLLPAGWRASAQSTYAPEYDAMLALDGDGDPYSGWISKPYGGGTKAKPVDVWWQVDFAIGKPITLKGVKIVGDHRDEIPLQKNLQIQVRRGGVWQTIHEVRNASAKDINVAFAAPVSAEALRVFVPAADLPKSDRADVDGIVRICEVELNLK